MSTKIIIEKNSVQETLIVPLYGRKMCTEKFPSLYADEYAVEFCKRLDYDFTALDKKADSLLYEFGALEAAMRQLDMKWEINDYLQTHPQAAIVNLGCGLDQTGRACDNGHCKIYNFDLPDIIDIRNQLMPAGEREQNISQNLKDLTWMDQIDARQGVILIAAGVFHYFKAQEIKTLILTMAEKFPQGRLIFDTVGRRGLKLMKKTLKNMGIKDIDGLFYVDDVQELSQWSPEITVSHRGYMLGYHQLDDPNIRAAHRFLAKAADRLFGMKIIRMAFSPQM